VRRFDFQRGQETLQAILAVSLVLLPVLFATLQLGTLLHLWIGQHAAAAAGARIAGERGEDDFAVRERITSELRAVGVDPGQASVRITPARVGWGEPITVTVTSQRRIAIPFLLTKDVLLTSSFTARGEVNH